MSPLSNLTKVNTFEHPLTVGGVLAPGEKESDIDPHSYQGYSLCTLRYSRFFCPACISIYMHRAYIYIYIYIWLIYILHTCMIGAVNSAMGNQVTFQPGEQQHHSLDQVQDMIGHLSPQQLQQVSLSHTHTHVHTIYYYETKFNDLHVHSLSLMSR